MAAQRTSRPLQIVIGCAPEDAPAARAIAQRLRVDRQAPWLAADELAEEREPLPALRAAIAGADAVMICVSRRSFGPGAQPATDIARLIDLLAVARPAGRLVIALKLGVCELPATLGGATVIELFGYSGYGRLLEALRAHGEALRLAAPPPEPPPPPEPRSPALTLRGRATLAALEQQGQLRRIGRGRARSVVMLAADQALVIGGGGAFQIDLRTQQTLWSIDCPTRCAALSPSGQLLALAGGPQINLWGLHDGRLRGVLAGHSGPVSGLAFSPDERTLASASHDRSLRLWRTGDDAASLASPLLASLTAHPDQVLSVAFSPDGALIATGAADRTVRIWRTLDRAPVQTLSGHGGAVEALAFSPDGATLAAGSRGRSLRLWAVRGWRILHSIDGHGGAVEALAFSPDGALVATGAADRTVRIWQVADGALRRTLAGHSGPIAGVSFSPDGALLAALGEDDRLIVWRADDGSEAAALRPLSGRVTGLAFSDDGGRLAVGGEDGAVTVHHLREDLPADGQQLDHRGAVSALAFAADGLLITAAGDRSVRASRLESGESSILLQTHGATQIAALAPGGRLMASSDGETTVQLWQIRAEGAAGGSFWRVLRGMRGRPRIVCFSPAGSAVAVASEDGSVQIWRVDDLEAEQDRPQITIAGALGRVRSLTFSADASHLAAGIETGQVQIWRAADGAATSALGGQGPAVVGLAFAPDGRSLASGDAAGHVWVWRLPSATAGRGKSPQRRREAATSSSIAGHAGAVDQLAFSPAGGLLASGSSDGTVRLWRV